MVRRAVAAFAALVLALALLPAAAFAHATLQSTVPERGAKLDKPPAEVAFRFDEPVEASFGALRVFDSKGQEVQTGKAFHPQGKGEEIAVKLKPGLGDGTYTATYRVVSADGHPVSSGFVFTVGEASAPAESLDQLLAAGGGTGPITNTALAVARAVQYAAIALGLGALIFFAVLLAPGRRHVARVQPRGSSASCSRPRSPACSRRSPRSCCRARSARAARSGPPPDPDTVGEVLGTRFGRAWGTGALLWIVTLAVLATRPLRPRGETRGCPGGCSRAERRDEQRGALGRRRRADRAGRPAPRPPRRPSRPPGSRRSPSRSACSRCCRPSAVTRACSRRWRCCCPRTSSTCSR